MLSVKKLLLLLLLCTGSSINVIVAQILEPFPLAYSYAPKKCAIANVNNDGVEDFLVFAINNWGRSSYFGIHQYTSNGYNALGEAQYQSEFIPVTHDVSNFFEADLNGDDIPEFILQGFEYNVGLVNSLLVKEDSLFQFEELPDELPMETDESIIKVFDRTNDGYDDIAVLDGQDSTWVYEYNVVSDSYDKSFIFYVNPFAIDRVFEINDINGDGIVDYVYVNENQMLEIQVSENSNSYATKIIGQSQWIYDVLGFYDMNSDGTSEFVYYNGNDDVLLYTHDLEAFQEKTLFPSKSRNVVFLDYNLDGLADVYIPSYQEVGINNGNFEFVIEDLVLPFKPYELIQNDKNILSSTLFEFSRSIYRNDNSIDGWNRSIVFVEETNIDGINDIESINLNGNDELFVSSGLGNCIYAIPQVDESVIGSSRKVVDSDRIRGFDINDFNQDGLDDIVVANRGAYNEVYIKYGKDNGGFSLDRLVLVGIDTEESILTSDLISADFDSDGLIDVAVATEDNGLMVFYNKGDSFAHEGGSELSEGKLWNLNVLDINMDGRIDILAQQSVGVVAYLNSGEGIFERTDLAIAASEIYLLDFDNDNLEDLVTVSNQGVSVYSFNQGELTEVLKLESEFSDYPSRTIFFDYNGDGYLDVMIEDVDLFNYNNIDFVLYRNDENLQLLYDGYFYDKIGWHIVDYDGYYPFDWDEDGDLDILYTDAIGLNLIENAHNEATYVGKVFWDENQDMSYQDDEAAIPNIPVQLISQEQDTTIVYTNYDGIFRFLEEEGVYDLSIPMNLNCWSSESFDEQIEISGEVNDSVYHHPIVNEGDGLELSTSFTSSPTRCGFTVKYNYSINNTGCSRIKANVKLALDQLIENISGIDLLNYEFSDNVLTYEIEDLLPNESSRFSFFVEVPGVEYIGETMIDSMQVDYGEYDAEVLSNTEVREYRSTINCAYDPNDKMIEPNRSLDFDANYVLDEELIYKIRFQNTGTDTAFNIFLIDTISKNLDLSTFVPMNSSHPYRLELDQDLRVLRINYDDILLPDSTVNETASHGFFNFSIRPKENLDDGTKITNNAYIYFDFNYPIVTNRVDAIYVNELPNPVSTIEQNEGGFVIYPNPVSRWIHLQSEDEILKIDLLDVNGNYLYSANDTSIFVGELSQGFYLIRVLTKMGYFTQRFVKM